MKTVNTTGLKCPEPLIMTKRALKEIVAGERLRVITDNDTSLVNLKRFLSDNKAKFNVSTSKGIHTITIESLSGELSSKPAAEYCELTVAHSVRADKAYIVLFSSEGMGAGNDDLGMLLTKSFMTSIIEADTIPEKILFYNSGVKLAVSDSFVLDELKRLESMGVKLMLCGTCVNFFNIKKDIKIGIISNMLEMSEAMINAPKVIKP